MQFKVQVGRQDSFDGISCDLDENSRDRRSKSDRSEDEVKSFAVKTVTIVSALFVTSAGGYGLFTGSWEPLGTLWVFLGPVVGALIGKNIMPNT